MLQPIRGQLFIERRIRWGEGKLECKEQPQAEACCQGGDSMRENSLHERNASYNRADGIAQTV
jgi:hypothetical protein